MPVPRHRAMTLPPRRRTIVPALVAAAAIALLPGCGDPAAPASSAPSLAASVAPRVRLPAVRCTRWASPDGSDRAGGGAADPWRTVQRLADGLGAGGTGCLLAGTYRGDLRVGHGGAPGRPVTLSAAPGARARVVGRVYVPRGSDHVTITRLALDGRNPQRLPSPTVNADDVRFVAVDVTNGHTGICFDVGSPDYGAAHGTLIARSRIHGCGRLPATNHDHGIYVSAATGTRILDDVIYGNADRGIQLFPDAQGTVISRNVIDRNGEGVLFSGADGRASGGTLVVRNLITNSRLRADVESYYPEGNPPGAGNLVRGNCIHGGRGATVDDRDGGFTARRNIDLDPGYRDARAGDYRLARGSPCAALLGRHPQVPLAPPRRR